jgi:multidrug efflux pump subunit AcrA (membrane-fusion protein)
MKKKWLILLFIALLVPGFTGCDRIQGQAAAPTQSPVVPVVTSGGAVVVEGNIVPRDFTRIYTRAGGKVLEVLVKEGDVVDTGALLARMDGAAQFEAARSAAELEKLSAQQAIDDLNEKGALLYAQAQQKLDQASRVLIEAQQKLDDYDTDQHQTDLDNAKTDVANAQDDLDDANDDWDKNKDLDVDNANRKSSETRLNDAQKKYDDAARKRDRLINDLSQYQVDVEAAQKAVDDAQREVDRRKGGAPDPDDLALAQARLANAESQIKAAQAGLDDLELKAPFAGTVVELDTAEGEIMLPSQQLAVLADLGELFVETSDLTEMDVIEVSVGDAALVTPDALPETGLEAVVESIDQISGKKGGDVTYLVRLKMNETDPALRWGMTVEVRFEKK